MNLEYQQGKQGKSIEWHLRKQGLLYLSNHPVMRKQQVQQ